MKKQQAIFTIIIFLLFVGIIVYNLNKYYRPAKSVVVGVNNVVTPTPGMLKNNQTPPVAEDYHPLTSYSYKGVTVSINSDEIKDHKVPVYITRDNKKQQLIKDVPAFDGGPNFSTTTNPNIVGLRSGYGDGPGGFSADYYITLSTARVFTIESSYFWNWGSASIVDDFGNKTDFHGDDNNSNCGTSTPPTQHKATVNALLVNQSIGYVFTPPFTLQCFSDSPDYESDVTPSYSSTYVTGFNQNFTIAYVTFKVDAENVPQYYFEFDLISKTLKKIEKLPNDQITIFSQ